MSISFAKIQETAPDLLNLSKVSRVELSKKNLDGAKAKVVLVVDYSFSMASEYHKGKVQRLAEKVLAISTGLDDDGEIDFFVFDSGAAHLGVVSLADYKGAVDRLVAARSMGSTNYAAAFLAVRDHFGFPRPIITQPAPPAPPETSVSGASKAFLGGMKKFLVGNSPADFIPITVTPVPTPPVEMPVFAIFLTDGSPDSRDQATNALIEVSTAPIFWKFLSIGPDPMEFLQELDDLTERNIDNADYQPIGDVEGISDKELFKALLEEYPEYVVKARAKGMIL